VQPVSSGYLLTAFFSTTASNCESIVLSAGRNFGTAANTNKARYSGSSIRFHRCRARTDSRSK
jgi:hypothetical protein